MQERIYQLVICCSALLRSRITSAGMMADRDPFGSGNCLSCRFTTPAAGLKQQ